MLEDVQTLNGWATDGKLDITKLSFPALFDNMEKYSILNSGAALGKGVGPLLIGSKMVHLPDLEHCKIATPGENTTANFLLNFAFPFAKNKIPMLFSSIEDAVLNEEADFGVIIHENRFTYQQKGLHKICDLGEVWEKRQGLPIPLGCIAAKKDLPGDMRAKLDNLIKESLQLAFQNYPEVSAYVKQHSQEMDEEVMRKHIELYVNEFSLQLGTDGQAAIQKLFEVYNASKGNTLSSNLFIS